MYLWFLMPEFDTNWRDEKLTRRGRCPGDCIWRGGLKSLQCSAGVPEKCLGLSKWGRSNGTIARDLSKGARYFVQAPTLPDGNGATAPPNLTPAHIGDGVILLHQVCLLAHYSLLHLLMFRSEEELRNLYIHKLSKTSAIT